MTTYDFTFFDYTQTWLTCIAWYTQLQLLVQTKPVKAQDVTLTSPKYIFKKIPGISSTNFQTVRMSHSFLDIAFSELNFPCCMLVEKANQRLVLHIYRVGGLIKGCLSLIGVNG